MTNNPYSTNNPHASQPAYNPSWRAPSYANVAAGSAGNLHPSRFNTLSAWSSLSSHPSSTSTQQHQVRRERSRSSLGGMEVDGPAERSKRPISSWSNDMTRIDGRMGCSQHEDHLPFCTPSYLRQSRHVQRLHKLWSEHVAELREHVHLHRPRQPSPSRSSSNVNLGKMHPAHVHRGPVQDVIERIPPPAIDDDKSHPLPSRWSEDDKQSGMEILANGSEVRFAGLSKTSDEAASVRADHFMPKEVGLYYFEVTILSRGKDGLIGVGFSDRKVPLTRLPGWEPDSWAYHGDDGNSFASTANGKAYGPKFGTQDVVGCGFNFRTSSAFFTKNGVYLGEFAWYNSRRSRY